MRRVAAMVADVPCVADSVKYHTCSVDNGQQAVCQQDTPNGLRRLLVKISLCKFLLFGWERVKEPLISAAEMQYSVADLQNSTVFRCKCVKNVQKMQSCCKVAYIKIKKVYW